MLHVVQSDWNYVTAMLKNNKPVMLSSTSSLFNEIYVYIVMIYIYQNILLVIFEIIAIIATFV